MTMLESKRLPVEAQRGVLPEHPAVKTPWDKLVSFHDAQHYACRHIASVASSFMQVLRIVMPDYEERATAMVDVNIPRLRDLYLIPGMHEMHKERHNIPPFVRGTMIGALAGDEGDEANLMTGRVVDYDTYRFEKELDTCPWDIVGSELCRTTVAYFGELANTFGEPHMEFNMVEAKGCGDRHCRIVAENRDKFPMPPRTATYETFGPIATADQIRVTPEAETYSEPQQYRPESGGMYRSAYCAEWTAAEQYEVAMAQWLGSNDIISVLEARVPDKTMTEHVTRCVFGAAGKMAFAEMTGVRGVRDWLGVPADLNDGRVLGGLIEVVLQSTLVDYTIVAFDAKEVVLDINRDQLERGGLGYDMALLTTAYVSLWHGMVKTLVGTEWSLWRETDGVDEGTVRIRIAKRIDKFS